MTNLIPGPWEQIAADVDIGADELRDLRAAARGDPVRGAPLVLDAGTPKERMIEPGAWSHEPEAFRTGLPPACPIVPLGSDGETFWFLNTLGQVHSLKASSAGKGPIEALFQGRGQYLEWAWPRWQMPRNRSEQRRVKGYEADECRMDLFKACAYKGTFSLEDQVRGRGAWLEDDGSLIYHAGDAVLIGGRWRPPGEHGKHIYPNRPRIGRPSHRLTGDGPEGDGSVLLGVLRTFNWERPWLDPRLTLGWAMTALIGGALAQRPVAMVNGEEGSGKTTLQKTLRALFNGALVQTSNTTQAGVYQRVQQDSIAVLIDESEAKEDTRTTDKMLELARVAYSGDKMLRGGAEGVGREFAIQSSFLFSSIAKPAIDAQDASRMAVMMLRPLDRPSAEGVLETAMIERIGRQMLRRWIDHWPRWPALLTAFRGALIGAGHGSRSCDTFAPLAAAAHLALRDDPPAEAELAEWAEHLAADTLEETATAEKTWRRCLTHLLQAQPRVLEQRATKTVGEALARLRDSGTVELDLDQVLGLVGLAVSYPHGESGVYEAARLFVPAKSPALHALFAGTPWAGRLGAPGPWSGVLRQMPRQLWEPGKCARGLDRKASGIFVRISEALEA